MKMKRKELKLKNNHVGAGLVSAQTHESHARENVGAQRLEGIPGTRDTTVPFSRGITLISLVITIIILLILAGVTINMTMGENGIFKLAQDAGKNYMEAQSKEEKELANLNNEIDSWARAGNSGIDMKVLSNSITTSGDILLSDNIEEYKFIGIQCKHSSASAIYDTRWFPTSSLQTSSTDICHQYYLTNDVYIYFYKSASNKLTIYRNGNLAVIAVYGIK